MFRLFTRVSSGLRPGLRRLQSTAAEEYAAAVAAEEKHAGCKEIF